MVVEKKERKNYLIQEFDEDVLSKGIRSRMFINFGLTHLVVGDKNKVLELLELHLILFYFIFIELHLHLILFEPDESQH
jgi:hypothetical protein